MIRQRWLVRIGNDEHSVEIAELDHPLLAVVDGVPRTIDWERGRASFDVAGHRARVAPRIDWRAVRLELVIAMVLGLMTGNAVGSAPWRLGIKVDGGEVRRDPPG